MTRFYCIIPASDAEGNLKLINSSDQTSLEQCRRVGSQNQFYVFSVTAKSKSEAPIDFQNHLLYTREELKAYLETPFEFTYTRPNPEKVLTALGNDPRYGYFGQHVTFSCPAGGTVNADFLFPMHAAIRGGFLFADANAVIGDTVRAQVVDTENVLGVRDIDVMGFGNGVVAQFLHWAVAPGILVPAESHDINELPTANMTLRIVYDSTGPNPVSGLVNFISYVVVP